MANTLEKLIGEEQDAVIKKNPNIYSTLIFFFLNPLGEKQKKLPKHGQNTPTSYLKTRRFFRFFHAFQFFFY